MSLALGTKVFSRTEDLRALIETLPEGAFDTIYVADDGDPSPKKESLYSEYDLDVKNDFNMKFAHLCFERK